MHSDQGADVDLFEDLSHTANDTSSPSPSVMGVTFDERYDLLHVKLDRDLLPGTVYKFVVESFRGPLDVEPRHSGLFLTSYVDQRNDETV